MRILVEIKLVLWSVGLQITVKIRIFGWSVQFGLYTMVPQVRPNV